MPIPKSRRELVDLIDGSFAKLTATLDDGGVRMGMMMCTDLWNVKGVLAVRAWWTESVGDWVEAGRRGDTFPLPADGYRWHQTPALNDEIVRRTRRESYRSVRARLDSGCTRVLELVAELSDRELLRVGAFRWAGKYPVARWISMNTATQYASARTMIRRAIRDHSRSS